METSSNVYQKTRKRFKINSEQEAEALPAFELISFDNVSDEVETRIKKWEHAMNSFETMITDYEQLEMNESRMKLKQIYYEIQTLKMELRRSIKDQRFFNEFIESTQLFSTVSFEDLNVTKKKDDYSKQLDFLKQIIDQLQDDSKNENVIITKQNARS